MSVGDSYGNTSVGALREKRQVTSICFQIKIKTHKCIWASQSNNVSHQKKYSMIRMRRKD